MAYLARTIKEDNEIRASNAPGCRLTTLEALVQAAEVGDHGPAIWRINIADVLRVEQGRNAKLARHFECQLTSPLSKRRHKCGGQRRKGSSLDSHHRAETK